MSAGSLGAARRRAALAAVTVVGAGGLFAVPAAADPASDVERAVISARGSAQCRPLRVDPRVAHAADIINHSTNDYLNHSAHNVPIDDPHPTAIVKDLGIEGTRAYTLQGAGHSDADAIKGALLEGYNVIPDCAYTDVGASRLRAADSGLTLIAIVLVGP